MPVTYSPTGADRKPKDPQPKAPSLWEKLTAFLKQLNDTSGVNAGTYGYQKQQPVRYRRQNTMPSSGQKALTMPTRDRFQDGDPRADRRPGYTATGQVRFNPYAVTPTPQYQFSDGDPRADRLPAIGRFNGYNPEGFIPMTWWYGDLNPNQGAGVAGNLNGGYGGLGSRISYGGGGGRGSGGGGGSYPGYGARTNADYIPGWLQQMVNWKV